MLMSIGRKANTNQLGLENIGVKFAKNDKIIVSKEQSSLLQTNIDNIYAIGDVIDGPMLAHKAEEDGVGVIDFIVDG